MFFFHHPDLRVSDADRETAVDFLKRHYAAGRLTDEELSARVEAAYAARYDRELDALTGDLPALPPTAIEQRDRVRRPLGPVAAGTAVAVAGIAAAASLLPPEAWVMLLGLGLPLIMVALFTVAPLAVPVLALVWLARGIGRSAHARRELLPRGSGGRFGVWEYADRPGRYGQRRARWP